MVIEDEEVINLVEVTEVFWRDIAVELSGIALQGLWDFKAHGLDELAAAVTGGVEAQLAVVWHHDGSLLALELRVLGLEFLEGLFGLLDQLIALVLLVHGISDGGDLIAPRDQPVLGTFRLQGGRSDVLQRGLRLLIHCLVHGDDLGWVVGADFLQHLRGETGCGVVDHVWLGIANEFL